MKKCNHCGQCCLAITCALGQAIFLVKEDAICPAIETDNGLYYCGLVCNTAQYTTSLVGKELWKITFLSDLFIKLIGIGVGCTNGELTHKEHKVEEGFWDVVRGVLQESDLKL